MLYIGSTAKSGTHFTTEFLNRLEICVGHEYPGIHGMVTWYIFHTPREFPREIEFNQDTAICLHQTRHPLKTINSLVNLDKESWAYIRHALSIDLGRPLLERCMEYYYRWHRSLDNCTFTYPVEEITELLNILDLFEVPYNKNKIEYAMSTPHISTGLNKNQITWEDLRRASPWYYEKIRELEQEYYA